MLNHIGHLPQENYSSSGAALAGNRCAHLEGVHWASLGHWPPAPGKIAAPVSLEQRQNVLCQKLAAGVIASFSGRAYSVEVPKVNKQG